MDIARIYWLLFLATVTGWSESKRRYFINRAPPVLGEVSPSFLIQKEGDTVDMFCEATATPEATLTWYKNSLELVASDRLTLSGNRVQITSLIPSDGGRYSCTFKNIVGHISHSMKLVIEGNAYIMVPPKNTTATEGSKVKLSCQAEGYPNNITYSWYKTGVDYQRIPGLFSRARVFSDGSFVIDSALREDTGWYKCQPSNGFGPAPHAEAYLNVTFLARVLNMPVRLFLPQGMLGRIECPVEANPPVTFVRWTKDEETLTQSPSRVQVDKQGALVIKTVMPVDKGRYSCIPYSALGAGRHSTTVQVIVKDPPYFVVRPKPIYQRQPTNSVTMHCMAEGDPKPEISWRKADKTFPSPTKTLQDGGNLTVMNLGKEDHGTYECVANNIVTTIITTSLLIIELTTPHAPYNVSAEMGQFSAKISWLPAYDGGFPQHYVLWFRMTGGSNEWQTIRVVPDSATSITVYRLYPDTQYQFHILSRNRLGDGLFSEIITASTKGQETASENSGNTSRPPPTDVGYIENQEAAFPTDGYGSTYLPPLLRNIGPRPSPPQNLTVQHQGKGLLIRWYKPRHSKVPVIHYIIEYRTVGRWVPLAKNVLTTSFLWETSSRGAVYHFRVFSIGQLSQSEPCKVFSFATGDPMEDGIKVSEAMIGGIVGGLLFLFIAITLAVIGIRMLTKRRQREKALRYGNVKYFGPKQVEANKNQFHGQLRAGRSSVVEGVIRGEQIFTLPRLQADNTEDRESILQIEKPSYRLAHAPNERTLQLLMSDTKWPGRHRNQGLIGGPYEQSKNLRGVTHEFRFPPGTQLGKQRKASIDHATKHRAYIDNTWSSVSNPIRFNTHRGETSTCQYDYGSSYYGDTRLHGHLGADMNSRSDLKPVKYHVDYSHPIQAISRNTEGRFVPNDSETDERNCVYVERDMNEAVCTLDAYIPVRKCIKPRAAYCEQNPVSRHVYYASGNRSDTRQGSFLVQEDIGSINSGSKGRNCVYLTSSPDQAEDSRRFIVNDISSVGPSSVRTGHSFTLPSDTSRSGTVSRWEDFTKVNSPTQDFSSGIKTQQYLLPDIRYAESHSRSPIVPNVGQRAARISHHPSSINKCILQKAVDSGSNSVPNTDKTQVYSSGRNPDGNNSDICGQFMYTRDRLEKVVSKVRADASRHKANRRYGQPMIVNTCSASGGDSARNRTVWAESASSAASQGLYGHGRDVTIPAKVLKPADIQAPHFDLCSRSKAKATLPSILNTNHGGSYLWPPLLRVQPCPPLSHSHVSPSSSGLGSKETSQSASSYLSCGISTQGTFAPGTDSSVSRPIIDTSECSVDENYEFDSALETELLNKLRYSNHNNKNMAAQPGANVQKTGLVLSPMELYHRKYEDCETGTCRQRRSPVVCSEPCQFIPDYPRCPDINAHNISKPNSRDIYFASFVPQRCNERFSVPTEKRDSVSFAMYPNPMRANSNKQAVGLLAELRQEYLAFRLHQECPSQYADKKDCPNYVNDTGYSNNGYPNEHIAVYELESEML